MGDLSTGPMAGPRQHRIASVTLREVKLPLRTPFVSAAASVAEKRTILVQLETEQGIEAWGECVALEAPTYTPETVETAWLMLKDWLVPALLDLSWDHPSEVARHLASTVRGHPMARAALEMPCWDIAAQAAGLPLAKLLGGSRETVETGVAIGLGKSLEGLQEQARGALEEGYRRIRLKIQPGQDLDPVAAVRQVIGNELALAVDANGSYTLEDAEHLRQLEEFNLQMIEQPLARGLLLEHAELQRSLTIPIALDETIGSLDAARQAVGLKCAKVINVKPGRVGGLTAALEIHDLCQQAGLDLFVGGMLETGIGRAYNVALASLPGFNLPGDLSPSARYWRRDLVEPEWTMEDGLVAVPLSSPGLGIEIDLGRIESLTLRQVVLGARS